MNGNAVWIRGAVAEPQEGAGVPGYPEEATTRRGMAKASQKDTL